MTYILQASAIHNPNFSMPKIFQKQVEKNSFSKENDKNQILRVFPNLCKDLIFINFGLSGVILWGHYFGSSGGRTPETKASPHRSQIRY